jgi:hypothetical protein
MNRNYAKLPNTNADHTSCSKTMFTAAAAMITLELVLLVVVDVVLCIYPNHQLNEMTLALQKVSAKNTSRCFSRRASVPTKMY